MVRSRSGFSLIEAMIVTAIVGIMASVAPKIFTITTKFFILSKTKLELQEQARAIMYIVTRELRQAQSSTIVIDQASGQPYYSRVSFTKIQGTSVTLAQSGSKLILTSGTTVRTLTSNLAYVAFTFPRSDDMTIISVSVTLQEQIYGGAYKALHMASERIRVMN